ncbi:deoxyadenosine/deoxycytidine kinase [Mycoplasma testudineum]|uniref:Deoxyadenosine/deoxycytidine kinase n=1 Tax=Mycoplasma testudineum TaxID=244584 RepID=A0A4R6IB08_9MOLU|nr:deoxynucleoside kinase [Mycoplasma testudineum]OYD26562.1 deoxyguanosine kinase [Mycoplasma testudineum]TDO19393.1 deoxyadenosine/deoxycytidine kinase [Mycoplasma testudineum]
MIIGISGMISAGKSSLVRELKKGYPKSLFLDEFSEGDEIFNTFLKWLYEKKEHLTMSFQSYIIESHSAKFHEILDDFNQKKLNKFEDHIFLDRFAIEHYIFAYLNLLPKGTKYIEAYDSLFSKMIFEKEIPDFAIFLDIDFENFTKRILKRGRQVEVDNFELNKKYFKDLHDIYKPKFIEMATKYKIPFTIVNTVGKTEKQVYNEVVNLVEIITKAEKIKYSHKN